MISKNDTFAQILRDNGCSVTATRKIVFSVLRASEPLPMHVLVERCTEIDRASVYRSAALFEKIGIIHRISTGWKYKLELSDRFGNHHHHATCSRCGQTIALEEDDKLEHSLHELANRHAFTITGHEIELTGLCKHCATL